METLWIAYALAGLGAAGYIGWMARQGVRLRRQQAAIEAAERERGQPGSSPARAA
jgi:hypothetical protein